MKILGIDPGFSGAFVQIDEEGKLLKKRIMPVLKTHNKTKTKTIIDEHGLNEIFELFSDTDHVFLEQVKAMPNQGLSSTFTFAENYGIIRGMIISRKMDYTLVTPQKWTGKIHAGVSKDLDSKKRSLLVFQRSYSYDFRLNSRCKNHHEGLIDALLIAEYGRRILK
jgi:hypothetical protein